MTEPTLDRETLKGNAGPALPQAAERSEQPDSADSVPAIPSFDPTDTTSFLQGANAIIGKAAWSVGRMAVGTDAIAFYEHAKHVRDEREAEEARELAHLAEWNVQMTMVGGVAMTNAEAQEARQRVIDNDETCAAMGGRTRLHHRRREGRFQARYPTQERARGQARTRNPHRGGSRRRGCA